jgi:hypothetical protein
VQRAVLCVETVTPADAAARRRIEAELLQIGGRHAHTARVERILFHPGFPVDIRHNAKIGREALAVWAARRVGLKA